MPESASYASWARIRSGKKASAAEPLAAACASRFSTALVDELEKAGYWPDRIDVSARVATEKIGRKTITNIHLDVEAAVPRISGCDFVDVTVRAQKACRIVQSADVNVCMVARLGTEDAK